MVELIEGLSNISFWGWFANFHGTLAMLSLILFGSSIVLYFLIPKISDAAAWLKYSLLALFVNLSLLDIAGLFVYIPYRAKDGPRDLLKASEDTAWLHTIIFEHKEFLAFAPPVLILTAFLVVYMLGRSFGDTKFHYLKLTVIGCLILALLFVLIVAGEAVLVTKVVPI